MQLEPVSQETLQGMDCGVFVGCCNLGGNDVDPYGLLAFPLVLRGVSLREAEVGSILQHRLRLLWPVRPPKFLQSCWTSVTSQRVICASVSKRREVASRTSSPCGAPASPWTRPALRRSSLSTPAAKLSEWEGPPGPDLRRPAPTLASPCQHNVA